MAVEAQPAGDMLRTTFLEHTYDSPLVVASGTLVEQFEQIDPFIQAGAGAVIPRTTRLVMERTVHPSPHLYQEGARSTVNMLNAEWTGADIGYWRPHLNDMAVQGKVIMAVSGRDIEGCTTVCAELDEYGFPYLEINVGCGVTNGVLSYITRDEEHIRRLVGSIKEAGVQTPIALKLGHSDYMAHLSQVAKEEGVDGIVAINTLGPVFDFSVDSTGEPQRVLGVHGARGGLSGSALFHTALTDVALIKREVGLPVAASGGVTTPERAAKMLLAGADLVQVYTYLHDQGTNAPHALEKLTAGLVAYMDAHAMPAIEQIKGNALKLMDLPTELEPKIPIVDPEYCTGCDRCIPACLPDAIARVEHPNRNEHIIQIIGQSCVGCGLCVAVCPVDNALRLPTQD